MCLGKGRKRRERRGEAVPAPNGWHDEKQVSGWSLDTSHFPFPPRLYVNKVWKLFLFSFGR